MSGQIPTNVILTKQGDQNVVVTTQNIAGTAQGTIVPNVQIVNMRPGTPVAAQKSVATVSPRVVIGTPQVVGARAAAPGITLQTLQGLQAGQQGHLLLKTENGQYQLLRVGPAPGTTTLTPQTQSIRLTSVPAPSGQTLATTVSTPQQVIAHVGSMGVAVPGTASSTTTAATVQQPVATVQKPSDNTKEKCRNFLANLLDLSSKEPKAVETNVRNLIQELINAQVEPEEFCDRLERLLNASPQPCLIGFLKKSLPLLRQSLVSKELVIEGIAPPPAHVAFGGAPITQGPLVVAQNVTVQKPVGKGGKISVLQNIPVSTKLNINKVTAAKGSVVLNKAAVRPPTASGSLSTIITQKATAKDKEKKSSTASASQQFLDDKMAGDDDINDVAAMGGVNLAEESQRILGSTEMIGTQIRSCKEEFLTPLAAMQSRIRAAMTRHGLEEPGSEVAGLLSHALQERIKSIVEKLAVIAQHRIDLLVKNDSRYEVTQDVKGQLKFLEELDRMERKRRDDTERELLLRAAKSRSKTEDPEQAKLKAKAKEMQRAEMEELRQREANLTALQAIGPRKKPRLDGAGGASETVTSSSTSHTSTGASGRGQMALRTRLKRINQRDVMFLMEQERETSHSHRLYKYYLK